jgi:hypothetical protein
MMNGMGDWRLGDTDPATLDSTWRIMDGLHEAVHTALLKSHRAVSALDGRRDAADAGYAERARRVHILLTECADAMATPNKLQANAEAHGRAVARTVQPLVGSSDTEGK